MNKHRFNIFPEMQDEDYNRLKSDIKRNGYDLKYPIFLYEDDIIDGWNRQRACTELGIQPIYKDFNGSNVEAIEFVMRTNKRRNLNSTQWACIAVEAEDLIEKLKVVANMNQTLGKKLPNPTASPDENKTATKLADVFNTNRTYINDAAKMKKEDPIRFEQLKSGEKTLSEVKKEIKKEIVQKKVEEHREELKSVADFEVDIFTTEKKFQIIYADPAWSYWEGGEKNQSLHYETMSMDDIKRLPVHRVSDDNCILFLWVTFPILKDALDVINEWGFKYSTCGFVWVKKNTKSDSWFFGNGSWTRANSELCLIGTKGSITRINAGISQVLDDIIGEHSQKPPRVRNLITDLVGELPRIELFSRNDNKDGWFNWGNAI